MGRGLLPLLPLLSLLAASTLAGCAANPAPGGSGAGAGVAATVILVRHAERASESDRDSPLSEAGRRRAEVLAEALADARVSGAVVTQRRRTQETAAPTLARAGVVPDTVLTTADEHPAAVAAAVRRLAAARPGGTVLVVGHSDTIAGIIGALGGPAMKELCAGEYERLFVLSLRPGAPAALLRARFGAADPAGAHDC
jgi:broad specificity phosphatase PhoE